MSKEMDVILTKTKICRKARLEVLLIGVVCCVLLACTLLYLALQRPQPIIEKSEAFSLRTYVSETPYPTRLVSFAELPRMDLKDYKTMIKDSDQINDAVPKGYKKNVIFDDMQGKSDVEGMIQYTFYKDEEHSIEAYILYREFGMNPYVGDDERYPFKAFRDYRMIVAKDKRGQGMYSIHAFHRTKPYKYNIDLKVENDEEVVQFIESFFV